MKKDMKIKINDNLEQKEIDNFRNNINRWIKVVGILVLVLIIMGMANSKNGDNKDRDSAIEYEARSSKRLNGGTDGRIYEENEYYEGEEVLEERAYENKESEAKNDDGTKNSSDKKIDNNTKKVAEPRNENKAKKVSEAKVNNDKKALEGKVNNNDKVETIKPNNKNTQNKTTQKVSETSYISRDKAKSIAFNNAGVSASKVRDLEIELDYENGRRVYEVGFESANVEYSYEIDAQSGKILRKEKDVERRDNDRYDD